jgi:hypothetical protein
MSLASGAHGLLFDRDEKSILSNGFGHGSYAAADEHGAALGRRLPRRIYRRQVAAGRDDGGGRVAGSYRYYPTRVGGAATAAARRLTEAIIIPALTEWQDRRLLNSR